LRADQTSFTRSTEEVSLSRRLSQLALGWPNRTGCHLEGLGPKTGILGASGEHSLFKPRTDSQKDALIINDFCELF
jgi:hypothetical protein